MVVNFSTNDDDLYLSRKNLLTEISLPGRLTPIRNLVAGDESECVVADDTHSTPTHTDTEK